MSLPSEKNAPNLRAERLNRDLIDITMSLDIGPLFLRFPWDLGVKKPESFAQCRPKT